MVQVDSKTKHETIIVVDDDITNLTAAKSTLSQKYNVITAPSGEKLFLLLEKVTPELILLDVEMPGLNGYSVMEMLKNKEKTAHIPVIFLTAKIDPESELRGLNLGAVDYITKPFSRELLVKRVDLHIIFEQQRKELLKYNLSLESEVDKKTRTVLELQNAILKTVAELVERRDNVTGGHIERTQYYLKLLVDILIEHDVYTDELLTWDIDLLVMSSQLHDVGKISIKDEILMKPGRLTPEEFEEMKKHSIYGEEIIRKIEKSTTENDFLLFAEIMAGSHHEKWNGKGYPRGLKGEDIPLQGRLMSIVDVYDALTDERPYKKAFSHEKSIGIIRDEKGEHFDPYIAELFLLHHEAFEKKEKIDEVSARYSEGLHTTIKMITNTVGARGSKQSGHVDRMQRYLEILVNELKEHKRYQREISAWDTELFLMSAQLHDVGKIAVTDRVLNKSEALTDDEHREIKAHSNFGARVVSHINKNVDDKNFIYHAEALAGSHHERWDGTGYPHGLKGEEIPLQGRIMAIVDVYDALTTNRPHRDKKTHNEAVEIIMSCGGTHFDPDIVDVFLRCEKEFENVSDTQGGLQYDK